MAETLQKFRDACSNFHDARAREFLSKFPKSSEALWVVQEILSVPDTTEESLYYFQAAIALRQTLILHWSTYDQEKKLALQSFIVQTVLSMMHVSAIQNPATKILCGAAAIALKLQWTSSNAATEFLQCLVQFVQEKEQPSVKLAGLMMLQAVVEEMSTGTATPLGLSIDYHRKCCTEFQNGYLLQSFEECVRIVGWMEQANIVRGSEGAAVCFASLRVMNAILSWDFKESKRIGHRNITRQKGELRSGLSYTAILLETSWAKILGAQELTEWIAALATEYSNDTQHTEYLQELQSYLLNLCCIKANTFPGNLDGKLAKKNFRHNVLRQLLRFLPSDSQFYNHQDTLAFFCRCFDALMRSHTCGDILAVAREIEAGSTFLERLCYMTQQFLNHGSMSSHKMHTTEQECCISLLQVWSRLCTPEVYEIYKKVSDVVVCSSVRDCARRIFESVLLSDLTLAAENLASAEEDNIGEEMMEVYASIAQACASESFPLLSTQLQQHKDSLCDPRWQREKHENVLVMLERMAFLVELTGCSLADDVLGDEPAIPIQLAEISRNCQSIDTDPVVQLSATLLNVNSMLLDSTAMTILSEHVVEQIVTALVRWAETYLIAEERTTSNLMLMFGDNDRGRNVVQQLCSVTTVCLTKYPTNLKLQKAVCSRLLTVLTRSPEIRKHVIVSPSWSDLVTAFSALNPVFLQMHHKMGRHIAYALCLASDALEDEHRRFQYLTQLLNRSAAPNRHFDGLRLFKQGLFVAEVKRLGSEGGSPTYGCFLLEILRGVTQATRNIPHSRKALYALLDNLFQPLLNLLRSFDFDENFTCSVLKLAAEIVAVHILFVEDPESERLLLWVLEMLKQFSTQRQGVKFLSASETLSKEKEVEQCRDTRAMLCLLKNVTDRELIKDENSTLDIATIVLRGMDLVIPLMTTEMLKFPKLCFQYFDLLSHLCEVYPQKIAELPLSSQQTLMGTLDFGLTLSATRELRIVLESLESLAEHQLKTLQHDVPVFSDAIVPGNDTFASYFMRAVLRRLLESDEGADAIAPSSFTLFYLFHCEQQRVEQILREVISSFGCYPSLTSDVQALLSSNDKNEQTLVQTQDAFRERLHVFVKSVRQQTRTH